MGKSYCMAAWLPNVKRSTGTKIPGLLYWNTPYNDICMYMHCHLLEIHMLMHLMSLLRNIRLHFTNQCGQAGMNHVVHKDGGLTCQCNKVKRMDTGNLPWHMYQLRDSMIALYFNYWVFSFLSITRLLDWKRGGGTTRMCIMEKNCGVRYRNCTNPSH